MAVKGGFLLKTVNSENSSEMLLIFYIFTSDPVMNSCHKLIYETLARSKLIIYESAPLSLGGGNNVDNFNIFPVPRKEYS